MKMQSKQENITEAVAVAPSEENIIDPNEFKSLQEEVIRLRDHKVKFESDTKAKADKLKADADAAAKDKAEADGNYKDLLALREQEYAEKIKGYEDKLTAYDKQQELDKITAVAEDAAKDLTKHALKSRDLVEKLAKMVKITDAGAVVVDAKGVIVSDKPREYLTAYATKHYDYLCDGLQSTGSAGLIAVKPIGTNNHENLDPLTRLSNAYAKAHTSR